MIDNGNCVLVDVSDPEVRIPFEDLQFNTSRDTKYFNKRLNHDLGIPYCRVSDIQKFHKRLRKRVGPFRFFAVCEYGPDKLRPHYHICYFFDNPVTRYDFDDAVFKEWFPQTRITIDTTNDRAANYILSYCLSKVGDDIPKEFWPKIRCSNRPFIGAGLLDNQEFLDWLHLKKSDISNYVGYRQRLPRIFRDKVFSDEEKMFIQKELGRALQKKQEKHKQALDDKIARYGIEKGIDYHCMSREAFNRRVQRASKLKSIK